MNLSEPLDGLTSAVEAAVLRVLARADSGFSGRQVHALGNMGSTSSVHRALNALVRVGLVTSEARPPSIIYRANRGHVLWPAVELGLTARSRAFDAIRDFCTNDLPREFGLTVIVFGSVARRDSTADSDLDLFVAYPDGIDHDTRADVDYRLATYCQRVTGNESQVYSIERGEIASRISDDDPLVANVLAEGITIYGPPLHSSPRRAA